MASPIIRIFGERETLQRQYSVATAIFVVLVVLIILAFGQLISQSLSRRYLEDLFVTGRGEAQRLAEEVGRLQVEELDVFEQREERLTRTLEGDPQRRIWDRIVVTDRQGEVVYEWIGRTREELPAELASHLELEGLLSDEDVVVTEDSYEIVAPVGEIGDVVLSINRGRITERVSRLRRQLLGQTVSVATITLTTLVLAFVLVWFLIQRTRRLEARNREAEEFAALGALAANLAHEIRNPLNSINLNLELLQESLDRSEGEVEESLSSTRQEVGRLARLVTDFLAYARPAEPVREEVRIVPLICGVRDFLRAEAQSMGVHLRSSRDIPDVSVGSDPSQLRQVLLNLVLNAVQAVQALEAERRVVELAAASDASSVTLVVRDRGDGIPEEDLDRVRTAFYTQRRGGTGLGLAIAERFVDAQGGRVELVNLEPIGFEARIVLPIEPSNGTISE